MFAIRTRDARPNLESIREQDDLRRGRDHRALGVDLLEAGIGQAGLDRDAVRRQERLVDVDLAEGGGGQLAAGTERLGPDDAARHDHGRGRVAHQLHGVGHRGGHDDEVPAATERPGEGERRGAGIEDDGAAVRHQLGGAPADSELLGRVLPETLGGAGLVGGPCGHRATAGPPDDAQLGQPQQVAPDGLVRHAQHLDQVAAANAAARTDQVRDHLESVSRQQLRAAGHPVGHLRTTSCRGRPV